MAQDPSASPKPSEPIILLNLSIATKLTKNNYQAWQSQIIPLLHNYGLHRFLDSLPPSPTIITTTGDQSTTTINEAYLSWHKQDQLLLGWLRSSLSEQLLAEVVSCTTSRELWQMLQGSFSATSRARRSDLRCRLQTTTKGGLNCSDYLNWIRSIADELAFIGSPVFDEDLTMHILHGLGLEYNPFVMATTTRQEPFSIIDLQAILLSKEVTPSSQGLHLSQVKYIRDVLSRANMLSSNPCPSPMIPNAPLSQFDGDPMENPHLYHTIVSALQYATMTRPDITFAVNKVSQFMHRPTTSHWTVVKRILRYLAGTISHGITLKPTSSLVLHAYSDADSLK